MSQAEHIEQVKVVDWCKSHKLLCFSVPNGTHIAGNKMQRARKINYLKAEGMLNGTTDLVVLLDKTILFIEMKRKRKVLKSGRLSKENLASDEQLEFIERVNGYEYVQAKCCYGADEAINFIKEFL